MISRLISRGVYDAPGSWVISGSASFCQRVGRRHLSEKWRTGAAPPSQATPWRPVTGLQSHPPSAPPFLVRRPQHAPRGFLAPLTAGIRFQLGAPEVVSDARPPISERFVGR
uniref:Uncharacterized protein n=1 Tax=Plectus sambesii TaxID=2011161 RepID=A0A914W284_9BILA